MRGIYAEEQLTSATAAHLHNAVTVSTLIISSLHMSTHVTTCQTTAIPSPKLGSKRLGSPRKSLSAATCPRDSRLSSEPRTRGYKKIPLRGQSLYFSSHNKERDLPQSLPTAEAAGEVEHDLSCFALGWRDVKVVGWDMGRGGCVLQCTSSNAYE